MVQKEFLITYHAGIHTRPGNEFVKIAKQFNCEISIIKDGKTVDGKSLLKIMKANIIQGDKVIVSCSGQDEAEALDSISDFLITLGK